MALLSALAWNLAHASEIKDLRVSAGATGTRAELALDQAAEFKVIRLSAPERLVVDLPASRVRRGLVMPAGAGIVKSVRTGQPEPGIVRVVFDLSQPVAVLKPHIEPGADGPRLVLEWPGDGEGMPAAGSQPASVAAPPAKAALEPAPTTTSAQSNAPAHASADDVAASNAATTRLISELAARGEVKAFDSLQKTAAASPPQPSSSVAAPFGGVASSTISASEPSKALVSSTGVPARIATGVPTPMKAVPTDPPATASITSAPQGDAVKTMKDLMRSRGMRPLVIAIDAGHGGQDPGATGQSGKREKDVTLAIARELARQINATPGLKAYLTRDTDVFIPLNRRAQLARQAKADMFVSIHADAAENRGANGSSVYVLSLKGASSQRARWLADKENASDLIGGVRLEKTSGTLASVLIDLTQSGQMKASEDAATHVLNGLSRIGRNHKPHIERANFAVLRTSDMPAMLVETAFISNPDEERRLTDPDYQRQLARAVLDGVNTYFLRQPPPGTLYAARAAADVPAGAGAGGGSP
ncbi:N-acetylmuramoyl-L-alanine amidase [Lysobacter sp. Root494]|uniref:N-acetylmuramoyl-L-alanine amidase n=1 Tax=Lysobacter sp. Root494 TaxID=1736549 RepID=UPI00138F7FB6|nr:N-acetylmuramoyl-L-alanine amidase [Lysobacter sp. Root494]